MNAAQSAALRKLLEAHPDHAVKEISGPGQIVLRCSCKWSRTFLRRNAMARVAKQNAAIREHLQAVEATGRG